MQEFRKLIKDKLAKKGISINKLAIKLGISNVFIRQVMSGKKTSRPLVLRLADYLEDPNIIYAYEKELQKKNPKNLKNLKRRCNHDKV